MNSKTNKIVFWVSTAIIFLGEGVMPALTFNSAMARQGFTSLGYPVYFEVMLTVFKVLGALILIIPGLPKRLKEWAYVGFGFDFICAFISLWVVGGFNVILLAPTIAFIILVISYRAYHKMQR
jgi:hypothetical protein